MEEIIDILIIGAGPAGMSAAINAKARNKSVKILSQDHNYLEKAENVDNYLGFYHITGKDLMNRFKEHITEMKIEILSGKVINILKWNEMFMVNFNGTLLKAKVIILAIGGVQPTLINNEERFLGKGVSYCATCDGMLYKNKNVIVSGLATDIIEETNFLASIGANVTLVGKQVDKTHLNPTISVKEGMIHEIMGDTKVDSVMVNDEVITTDAVFLLRDIIAPTTLINGLEITNRFVAVNSNMETNIPGIYACGDCTGFPFQIAKSVGEGLVAAQAAAKFLDSTKESVEYVR